MHSYVKKVLAFLCLFLVAWLVIHFALEPLLPFLAALVLALLGDPLVRRLRAMGASDTAAAAVGMTIVWVGAVGIVLLAGSFALHELQLISGVLPSMALMAQQGMDSLRDWLLSVCGYLPGSVRQSAGEEVRTLFSGSSALLNRSMLLLLTGMGSVLKHLPGGALGIGTSVIASYMISAKMPRIRAFLQKKLENNSSRRYLERLTVLKQAFSGYLLSQLKLMCVTFLVLAAGMLILRIPYAPAWALGISLVDALPILGTGSVLLPWSFLCLLQKDVATAAGLAGIYVCASVLRSVLEPRLVGRQLGLDPLLTLMTMYLGLRLWGILGMVVMPMLTVCTRAVLTDGGEK